MGGSNSVMSGGARSLKTIQDELVAENSKSPPSAEEDILRLTEEYENALAHKKTLENKINHPGTNSETKQRLEEELAALTEDYNDINESESIKGIPNNNKNGELNTASVAGIPKNNENNELNDETKAKLEKCKEKESKTDKKLAEENLEKTQESIKKNVPGFFSTFFGNWLSYDNWQSTPDEKEAAECKDLLKKYKKRSSQATEAVTEDDESGEETAPVTEAVTEDGESREETAPVTEAVTEDGESREAAPAPVLVPPADIAKVTEEEAAAPAPAPAPEPAPAPALAPAPAPALAPAPAPALAPATAGGRRYTHKNRQKRKNTHKNSRNTAS